MHLGSVFSLIVVSLVVPSLALGGHKELSEQERNDGWKLLFDGKTTEGWRGYQSDKMPPGWKVIDGAMVRVAGGAGGKGAGGGDDIITIDEYEDFELQLEWKVVDRAGNSGIILRAQEGAATSWHTGPEMQVLDNAAYPGRDARQMAGACYGLYAPETDASKPSGEWNVARAVARGGHMEHWLNGVKLLEYQLGSDDWKERVADSKFKNMEHFRDPPLKGHICLQDHTSRTEYRNIKIRKLAQANPNSAAKIRTDDVTYSDAGGKKATGYFARPDKEGKLPAIILIHEWWGLNDDIRSKADAFARLGFVALAVDMYGGESTTEPSEARRLASQVRGNMEAAQENLRDAVALLTKSPHVDPERIASIGWCFGGGWSYQMAKNNLGVKASVIYYGFFNPEDDLKKMRADIIGHFAENDRAIRIDNVKEFQAKLKTLNGDHEIYIYPNTTHGFASRKGANPNYDAEAADLARKRTLDFLKQHVVAH